MSALQHLRKIRQIMDSNTARSMRKNAKFARKNIKHGLTGLGPMEIYSWSRPMRWRKRFLTPLKGPFDASRFAPNRPAEVRYVGI